MADLSSREDLREQVDAAYGNLSAQLHGIDTHLERSNAPGEWTAREVLSHLLFQPGFNPVTLLKTFAHRDLPLVETPLFKHFMGTDEITIPMFVGALFGYHWNDHAGQLAKIRKAVGLPDTGGVVKASGIPI